LSRIAIVGGSAAGTFAAEGFRRHGFQGEIVIVGEEPAYDRPPLSKQFLAGDWGRERLALIPEARQQKIEARLLPGRARQLDLRRRRLMLDSGEMLDWDRLVVATGVRPRQLPIPGAVTLRSAEDALALADAIRAKGRLTILGAGFIGLEVAATARKLGAAVTVYEPMATPMAARLGPEVAAKLLDRHRREGVELKLGESLTDAPDAPLLVAVGCTPNTEWLEGSGLSLQDGVLCDAFCQAAEDVWAAGDVARWEHRGLGRQLRIEHRTNASEQGEAVARNILGAPQPYTPVPFFWTDQYDIKLQLVGLCDPAADRRIEIGSIEGDSFVQTFRRDGRLVGALAWNAAKAMTAFRREIRCEP